MSELYGQKVDWQPWATVPRDGYEVFAACEDSTFMACVALDEEAAKLGKTHCWSDPEGQTYYGEQTFSHWVRLENPRSVAK